MVVSNGLKLHVPFTCYYRSKYTITVQETEGAETRNHSARKQKSEGKAQEQNELRMTDLISYPDPTVQLWLKLQPLSRGRSGFEAMTDLPAFGVPLAIQW